MKNFLENIKYDVNLDNKKYLHFYMASIIVMYHVGGLTDIYTSTIDHFLTNILIFGFEILANIAMIYYFFISGFLLFNNLSYDNYFTKIKRRFFSLLFPFLIWNFFVHLLKVLVGKSNVFDFVYIFDMRHYPPNGPLWYMYCIFLLALMSPLFIKMIKKHSLILILFSSFICNYFLQNFSFSDGYLINLLHFFPIWLLGGAISKNTFNLTNILILIFLSAFSFSGSIQNYFIFLIEILIVLYLITKKYNIFSFLENNYKYSFLMYLIHGPLIEVFGKYVKKITYFLFRSELLTVLASKMIFLLLCIILCKLFYFIFKKNNKIINFITCNRG